MSDDAREAAERLIAAVDLPELLVGHCATGCDWCTYTENKIREAVQNLKAALAAPAVCREVAALRARVAELEGALSYAKEDR